MSNLFKKYASEGKEKTNSLHKRLSSIENILEELRIALLENDIELIIEATSNNRGVGFKVEISTDTLIKKFITVTIPRSERESYIVERNGEVEFLKTTDDLIKHIGQIISSVIFWHEIEELKRMDKINDTPF